MAEKRIGLRKVRALEPSETVWDATVPGFGARRQKGNAVTYVLKFRTAEGRQRWHTIGRHGAPWTPETARDEAKRCLGAWSRARPCRRQEDQRKAQRFPNCATSTWPMPRRAGCSRGAKRRKRQVRWSPTAAGSSAISSRCLDACRSPPSPARISTASCTMSPKAKRPARPRAKPRGLAHVRGGKGTASRTVGLLGAIFTYAVRHRMRLDNPAHGVHALRGRKARSGD